MSFFNKFFGKNEEAEFGLIVGQISEPLINKVNSFSDREAIDFYKIILDTTERSLETTLYRTPEEFHFKKIPTIKEVDFWFQRVSLAFLAYSYHFFSIEERLSYNLYWQMMLTRYNEIFNENITLEQMNLYASGLEEDEKRGYSIKGDLENAMKLMIKDYGFIAVELLEGVWNMEINPKIIETLNEVDPVHVMENVEPDVRKIYFLGNIIWQAYRQLIQPFLPKLMTDY